MTEGHQLPGAFCWTRYGTESGELFGDILRRKEAERHASGGTFLWGVGNSIAPSLRELLRIEDQPPVVFSPMRSRPAQRDVAPAQVARWRADVDLDGQAYALPSAASVLSRYSPERPWHYALVCHSEAPLLVDDAGPRLNAAHLRNLSRGTRVGASQVTSVVRRSTERVDAHAVDYVATFQTLLSRPFFIRLLDPVACRP